MIKNLRMLKRGLEADVQIGCDKYGAAVSVHVMVPIDGQEVAEALLALERLFGEAASDVVQRASVESGVRERIAAIETDVREKEKGRLERNAGLAKEQAERAKKAVERTLEQVQRELRVERERISEGRDVNLRLIARQNELVQENEHLRTQVAELTRDVRRGHDRHGRQEPG